MTDTILSPQPMSIGQRALWFEQQAEPAGNAYNLAACFRFPRPIEARSLDLALQRAGDHHPLLRARFDLVEGEACWWTVREPVTCTVLPEDVSSEEEAKSRLEEFLLRPYDLPRDPPLRIGLQRVDDGCLLAIGCHHIIGDLHSLARLAQELGAGQAPAGPVHEEAGYAEFVRQQRAFASSREGDEAASFWRTRLAGLAPAQGLGALESGLPVAAGPASRLDFTLPEAVSRAVRELSAAHGTTEFAFLLTAFQALLARHTGRDAIVVGAPSAGRTDPRFRGTLGYFVNLLPMVFRLAADLPFTQALRCNGADLREALRRGAYPYASMAQACPALGAGLVAATITFQKTVDGLAPNLARVALGLPGGCLSLAGQTGVLVPIAEPRAQFPLGLAVASVDGCFAGFLQFDPARISEASAREFVDGWLALVAACCETPSAPLGTLLDRATAGPAGGQTDTLLAALEKALVVHADQAAVRDDAMELSYRELDARSRAVAGALIARGIAPGDRIAVVGDGSAQTIVSLLGVLRTGAAFVPFDAATPEPRLRELQEAARVAAVLDTASADGSPASFVAAQVDAEAPAWLMFTSGTTGRPKAAIVPQAAALAHARGIARRFALASDDRVLQFASLSFDEHAEEIFPTLLAGACIVCVPRIRYEDPHCLQATLRQHAVSVLHLPTSYWHLWCDELAQGAGEWPASLRLVNAGGEQASLARLRQWARCAPARVRWFNSYGLTEAAVTSLLFELRPDLLDTLKAVPVGTPLPGTRVRIVDDAGHDVVDGAIGELLLGGAGLGTGYFDAPEASAARFFTSRGLRWLRTGDLARIVGCDVVIAGRRDRAVKLHGARLDLAEAEAALAAHGSVLECALDRAPDGEGLQAYVVPRPGHAPDVAEIQRLLQDSLGAKSLLVRLHLLAAIPRTPGRKPDYPALALHVPPGDVATGPGATGASDAIVRSIFARLLQRPQVDADTSFFSLGGHSLLAMRAVAAVRRELAVDLTIADFMAAPTVRGITALCQTRAGLPGHQRAPELTLQSCYPLSRSQRRLLAMAGWTGDALPRAGFLLRIEGEVDVARVARAWTAVMQAHPLLGAEIDARGNRERAPADVHCDVPVVRLEGAAGMPRNRRLAEIQRLQAAAPQGQGATATLFRVGPREHVLAMQAPLAAVDGDCTAMLLDVFVRAYADDDSCRQHVPASYAGFVQLEADWLASPASDAARAWWAGRMQAAPAPTMLGAMAASCDPASRRLRCRLAPEARHAVLALAAAQGCSPFTVLLAGFLVLLARQTGNTDLLIGMPVSLRHRLGDAGACGPTLNALPLRAGVDLQESFTPLVQRVQAEVTSALEHAPLPYEEITSTSAVLRGAPLPIQFVGQAPLARLSSAGMRFDAELPPRDSLSPVGLLAGVRIGEDEMTLEFDYRLDALEDRDALALLRSYRLLVSELAGRLEQAVGSARTLPWAEMRAALAVRAHARGVGTAALLHAGLRAAAIAHPDRVAIACGPECLTYAELDAWTDRHARRLRAAGVRAGDRVVVVSRMGVEEVIAACAVLKTGATYVPLAHDLPAERAARVAARVQARIATGAADLSPSWVEGPGFLPVLREADAPAATLAAVDPATSAYILFTSGSTGEPKGVEVSHRAAMVTVREMLARFAVAPDDVLYRHADLGFDLSVFDLFGTFAAGATLAIPRAQARGDAFGWASDVTHHRVTVWNSVPAALDMLLEAAGPRGLPSLRTVFASGDWIPLDLPQRTRAAAPGATFVGLGGATEASIWSCFHEVPRVEPGWRSIPYGRALGGQSMFVADEHGWPLPRGVAGEIRIGGAALATGYWNDEERTAAKFPVHPLTGERTYRTGDLGRTRADGTIEFLGRMDAQVKVRGTRVDLREIEQVLAACPGIRRALVVGLPGPEGRAIESLGAYVLADDGCEPGLERLKEHAAKHLSEAMRPTRWQQIDALPLTANGKVDRAALPAFSAAAPRAHCAGEATAMRGELAMFAIWRELLPEADFGRDDDFFAMGGHSLLAMRLLARVRRETGREVPLARWLEQPTIAHLSQLVERAASANPCPVQVPALRERVHLDQDLVFSPPRASGGAFVVTGATGLIGSRIVARLLAHPDAEVICIDRDPQRALPLAERLAPLLAGVDASWRNRVDCVQGDLALPRFGLDETAFAALARRTGWVFHAGAHVSLLAPYPVLAPANVAGTHEAIRLAALAGAPLCHVSSVGVVPYGAGKWVHEDDALTDDGRLLTGYCESKWVAEQTVRAAMARGLRAVVFRPGLTIGDQGLSAERDLLAMMMALSRRAGCVPATDFPIDLVDADHAAAAIEHIARDPQALGRTFHLTHPAPKRMRELRGQIDPRLPMRSFAEWQAMVVAQMPTLADDRLAALAALVAQHSEEEITPARMACANTDAFLRGSGIACPPVESILVRALGASA